MDPERMFVVGAVQNDVKTVCFGCPVRIECLAEALDKRMSRAVLAFVRKIEAMVPVGTETEHLDLDSLIRHLDAA
jgi:hypothetical protein